ncbi:xanthine dehydrogenase accessory protein XdhC [uncultured Roseibium sp.]|uniref:xanthine dehydrogenase accessory protein XdhC n=1 Tax=uncultured Roseibium sp. TaxID=1936171 RepID=UPI0026237636|nr:xanthine dehydrogenase accessory protein XdhC [uncultured Roseibium sp.]
MKVWGHIADCLTRNGACALVTVARADGSTPREDGARMVVTAGGGFYGTIGGGTLEFEAIRRAHKALRDGVASFELHNVSLGPDLGQCCGGRTQIAIEVLTTSSLEMAQTLSLRENDGTQFSTEASVMNGVVQTRDLLPDVPANRFLLQLDQKTGKQLLIEQFGSKRRDLYLFGAGHVGKAVVLALAPLPFSVTWIDSRADQFPAAVPGNVRKVASSDPAACLEQAPDGAFVLAMTHSHALDEDIMARALLQQRFAYCGVIGSKTKRARFLKRLKARGLNDTLTANMLCPVGVTSVKSKQPAAIAAGIAVDLLVRDEAGNHQQAAAGGGLAQKLTLGQ